MVNNAEYFNSISFNRKGTELPPASKAVVYSKTQNGWSVRDMPEDCIVPAGKIVLTNHSFKNLSRTEISSGRYINQKDLSISRSTVRDNEDIDIQSEPEQEPEEKQPEQEAETEVEQPEEAEEQPEEAEEQQEQEETEKPNNRYFKKFKAIIKNKSEDECKKLYYTYKMS